MQLSNAQHNQVMRVFSERRLNAINAQKERKKSLYNEIPALRELDIKLSEYGIKTLTNDTYDRLSFEDYSKQIHSKRLSLLKENGYPENYLDVLYSCPLCKDTGYIDREHCHCFYQVALEFLYSQNAIKDLLKNENLSSFSLDYYSNDIPNGQSVSPKDQAKKALFTAKDFVNTFSDGGKNLIITGNTGTGKTFLSSCIAGELLSKGYFVVFLSAFSFISIIEQNTFDKPGDYSRADYDSIFKADLLIIDDLGTENVNGFRTSKLFQCIDERLLNNRSTIITTNLKLDQLSAAYSERTVSRLIYSYSFLELSGQDIRIQKKLA